VLPPIIAARHARGALLASVCTGAFLLAAGGLLATNPRQPITRISTT
jgi:transcriptional regulator GlxA family with amidase domain